MCSIEIVFRTVPLIRSFEFWEANLANPWDIPSISHYFTRRPTTATGRGRSRRSRSNRPTWNEIDEVNPGPKDPKVRSKLELLINGTVKRLFQWRHMHCCTKKDVPFLRTTSKHYEQDSGRVAISVGANSKNVCGVSSE